MIQWILWIHQIQWILLYLGKIPLAPFDEQNGFQDKWTLLI